MLQRKNDLLETFNYRFACKQYDAEKMISEDDFNFILETARLSPSSFGWEPWKFVIVQDKSLRRKLKEAAWGAQSHLDTASHFVLVLARKSKDTKAGSDYLNYISTDVQQLPGEIVTMKMDFFDKFQQNDFDLTDDRKLFDWASKQTYIALGNMMTSAAHIGIDSCPIEGFDREKVESLLEAEGILDPNEFGLSVMASFGYRSPEAEMFPKTRQSADKVIAWV